MGGLTWRTGAFVVIALAVTAGCSIVVDTEQVQCTETADCAELGSPTTECVDSLCVEVDRAFSCRATPFPEPSPAIVNFSLVVVNLVGQTPYEGLTISSCPNLDAACASPIDSTITNAQGGFTLPLQEGFRGHLFAPPPAGDPELAPLKVHVFPPPSTDPNVPVRAGLVVTTLMVVAGIAQVAGRSIESGTGHLFFTAIDCEGNPLEGVTVSSSVLGAETFVSYVGESGQPDLSLVGTGANGQGSIINVPAGFVTVRGVHETEGKIFEQSVIVAADTITSVPIVPSPTP